MEGGALHHATATLAELSLAMALAHVFRAFPNQAQYDAVARDSTARIIRASEGKFVAALFRYGCKLRDLAEGVAKRVPVVCIVLDLWVLLLMAFGPQTAGWATVQFAVSCSAFLAMCMFLFYTREVSESEKHPPLIEPA